MQIFRKLTYTTMLIISILVLSGCNEVIVKNKDSKKRPVTKILNISPTANKEVFELLPKGPNNFTIDSKLGSYEVHVSGYINFDDCTTEASATETYKGESSTFRYINAGQGEAVSKNNQPFLDIISPKAPQVVIITPMFVLQNTMLDGNGIACSIGMLSELANIGLTDQFGATTLNWDYTRTDKFIEKNAKIFGDKVLKSLGAVDLDITMNEELILSLFKVSPETVMKKSKFVISKDNRDIVIKVFVVNNNKSEPMIRYTFTPTSKINIVPVPYRTWFDELKTDFIRSGKSFEEYIRSK